MRQKITKHNYFFFSKILAIMFFSEKNYENGNNFMDYMDSKNEVRDQVRDQFYSKSNQVCEYPDAKSSTNDSMFKDMNLDKIQELHDTLHSPSSDPHDFMVKNNIYYSRTDEIQRSVSNPPNEQNYGEFFDEPKKDQRNQFLHESQYIWTMYLTDSFLEHRKTKKLDERTYEALFKSIIYNFDDISQNYFFRDHPTILNLNELPGLIYVLNVPRGTKKPPYVGFSFRSYSDSHYTSVDRDNPIICKVKEWTCEGDLKTVWRLYHYYLGNKKRLPRKNNKLNE